MRKRILRLINEICPWEKRMVKIYSYDKSVVNHAMEFFLTRVRKFFKEPKFFVLVSSKRHRDALQHCSDEDERCWWSKFGQAPRSDVIWSNRLKMKFLLTCIVCAVRALWRGCSNPHKFCLILRICFCRIRLCIVGLRMPFLLSDGREEASIWNLDYFVLTGKVWRVRWTPTLLEC